MQKDFIWSSAIGLPVWMPAARRGGVRDPVDQAELLARFGRVVVGDFLVDKSVQGMFRR
ncbi:MAG: hypothetical protein HY867_14145 [Chloroflexi bacterium]|nr:hypothetical protein [Chloroflexota bacterium]